MNDDLEQIISKSRCALAGHWGVLSTGEKLAAALVLNRTEWLDEINYTIADAISRIGPHWANLIPLAAKALARERDRQAEASARALRKRKEAVFDRQPDDVPLRLASQLKAYCTSPGYRHVDFFFDAKPPRTDEWYQIEIRVRPEDAEEIVRVIRDVHRLAWSSERGPLDAEVDEEAPWWID